jgi:hypothetical protein
MWFCGRCGEAPLAPRDLNLCGFAEMLIHAFTSTEIMAEPIELFPIRPSSGADHFASSSGFILLNLPVATEAS